MLFVQGGSAHRIGLLYIIIQEQKEGIFQKNVWQKDCLDHKSDVHQAQLFERELRCAEIPL